MLKNNITIMNKSIASSPTEIINRLDKVDKICKAETSFATPRDRSNIDNYICTSNEKTATKTRTPRDRSNMNPITNSSISPPAIQPTRARRVRDVSIGGNDIEPIVDNSNIRVKSKKMNLPPDEESWFWGGDKE
jgi:hypothetical protein